jgi:hypothetical protein
MLRRVGAVGLLTLASLLFASRFRPPEVEADELEALLAEIELEPTSTRPSFGTLPPATTTTTVPLPPGVREYESDYVLFARGALQLRITIDRCDLIDVEMIKVPSASQRARQISLEAEPILRAEAIEVGGYRLHIVSGATETSYMYMRAMKDALLQSDLWVEPECELPLR